MSKLTLKEAIDKRKLSQFIKENENLAGDKKRFEKTIDSMPGKSKSVRQTLKKGSSES